MAPLKPGTHPRDKRDKRDKPPPCPSQLAKARSPSEGQKGHTPYRGVPSVPGGRRTSTEAAWEERARAERIAERDRLQATGWTVLQAAAQTGRPPALVKHAMFYGVDGQADRLGYPDEWGVVRAFPSDVQQAFPAVEVVEAKRQASEQSATEPVHVQRSRARLAKLEAALGQT